jgi:hypothetical protein
MSTMYYAYLKERRLSALNNGVDAAIFHSDDPEAAQRIAQARFAGELKDANLFVEIDTYEPSEPVIVREDEDE